MAYVPVPKDLSRVKTKVLFNLTKGQLICLEAERCWAFRLSFCSKPRWGQHGGAGYGACDAAIF
jgi:hypothetical protein